MSTEPPPEPIQPPPGEPMSWNALVGGVFLVLGISFFAIPISLLIGASIQPKGLGALVGLIGVAAVPAALALLGRHSRGFRTGVIVAGAVVVLIGGACNVSVISEGLNFH